MLLYNLWKFDKHFVMGTGPRNYMTHVKFSRYEFLLYHRVVLYEVEHYFVERQVILWRCLLIAVISEFFRTHY